MINLVMFVIFAVIAVMSDPKKDWGFPIALFSALFAMFIAVFALYPVPGSTASMSAIGDLVHECEKDLPRNQKCVIDISARPTDPNGM